MRIIWDATGETLYPVGRDGSLTSGSVMMIRQITSELARRGHSVHVVCNDLDAEEQRGPNLWYWGPSNHPLSAEVIVMTHQIDPDSQYREAPLVLAHTGCEPYLGPEGDWAAGVDAWPVFSETHKRLLLAARTGIPEERVFVTGLGVDLAPYADVGRAAKVPGRLLYANDPARGLWHVLDVFDLVREQVPEASLHIAYDFDRQLEAHRWEHTLLAQYLLECKRRIEVTPGVTSLGCLSRSEIVAEQIACQVHVMPSDPPNVGTQTHGLLQLECAAAGCALVLSDVEAFPEVFGEAAAILPVIGRFRPELERRIQAADYAEVVVELMRDADKWREASRKARALACEHTWEIVVDRWEVMLTKITGELACRDKEGLTVA